MLREHLHDGLVTLAHRRALHLSMEWIILNEPEWAAVSSRWRPRVRSPSVKSADHPYHPS